MRKILRYHPAAMSSEILEDRYEVLRPLGLGSLGRVDLVLDRQTNERRALKRLQAADPETVERLRNEFAALARLRHPHLVAVHDLGRRRGTGRDCHVVTSGKRQSEYQGDDSSRHRALLAGVRSE